MTKWRATWQIRDRDEIDLRCGEELVKEFNPFITYLVEVQNLDWQRNNGLMLILCDSLVGSMER
jgi:hypothetical protein